MTFDMNALLKQAQEMQEQMQQLQEEAAKETAEAGKSEVSQPELAHHLLRLRLDCRVCGPQRFIHSREDEVGEPFCVVGIDRVARDLDREHFARAVGGHLHHPAADRGLGRLLLRLVLHALHAFLHLGRLLHELVHVEAHSVSRSVASKVSLRSSRNFSSPTGSSACSSLSPSSPSANATASRRPVTS